MGSPIPGSPLTVMLTGSDRVASVAIGLIKMIRDSRATVLGAQAGPQQGAQSAIGRACAKLPTR